jgi:hypothetical protein
MSRWVGKLCFVTVLAFAVLFGVLPGVPAAHSSPRICTADMDLCPEPLVNCCCGSSWRCVYPEEGCFC